MNHPIDVSSLLFEVAVPMKQRLVWIGLLLGLLYTNGARADATVVVELKAKDGASVDGVVELEKGDTKHRCATDKGKCVLPGVAGGMYTVNVSSPGRPSPKPKTVMIPPSGEVKLIVNAS